MNNIDNLTMLIPIYEHSYVSICLYNLHQYFIVFTVTFSRVYFSPLLLSFIIAAQSLSHVQLSVTPWTAAHQAPLSSGRVCSNSCPLSLWCYRTISLSASPSHISFNLTQHQVLFQWGGSSHQVTKVLELQQENF